MSGLKSLFTRKRPLTSRPPNTATNSFEMVNPALFPGSVKKNLETYITSWKTMNLSGLAASQKALQAYAKEHPVEAKQILDERLNRRSYSDISNLSNNEIVSLKEEVLQSGGASKRTRRVRRSKRTRRSRQQRRSRKTRSSRRCGCGF